MEQLMYLTSKKHFCGTCVLHVQNQFEEHILLSEKKATRVIFRVDLLTHGKPIMCKHKYCTLNVYQINLYQNVILTSIF